ncbi:ABC transporter substrate-binding protein [Candidatus Chlamydia sanziniae]|uniref:Oligopeptide ABC transporter, periplasmic oligopeptide-binding protein OppA n=1 Tax=Candidatus Chlamydia sanziniae TaxID=1806891 RepID=A0A1A9HVT8_9CHLA|nr:ABC transporter substrate-binding protein [Candidatus Chlamydia sanziniae]ANH78955.1 Oligopeptide ABC transporter, periplasmic oligopeptide-binding protein OppA [Candidatus Chlamydia sanziniae]
MTLQRWFFLLFLSSLLSSCLASKSKATQSFTIAIYDDPTTLSPEQAKRTLELSILKLLFDGLTRENTDKPNNLEFAIARDYIASRDYTTYTFFIKENALWSDGTPLTSQDIRNAWEYARKNSPHSELFQGLTFHTPSLSTITITSDIPYPDLPKLLAFPAFAIFNPHNPQLFSGPFILVNYSPGNRLALQKNPHYYDYSSVAINSLHLLIIPDIYTAVHLLNRKKIDWVGQPWHQGIPEELYTNTSHHYYDYPVEGAFWLVLNTKDPHLANLQSRHRLAAAIDKHSLINNALHGKQQPANTLSRGAPQPPEYKKQKTLTPPEKLTLTYPSDILRCKHVAELLKEQWKAVGIDLFLEGLEYHLFLNKRSIQDYNIATQTGVAYYPSAKLLSQEDKLIQNLEIIPLYYMHYDYLTLYEVKDVIYNASGAVDLKYAHIVQK